jgi:predicted transcriptional regulator
MTSNVVPADDDLVYALTNIARGLKYGPDQAWIEEAIETIASLSSELARCRNALEGLRKLSRDATKGAWFTDNEDCETGHGNVMTLAIFAEELMSYGKHAKLFDAINSDAMEVDCDDDYDAPRLFDRTSYANAEFAVACVNFVREQLAALNPIVEEGAREP